MVKSGKNHETPYPLQCGVVANFFQMQESKTGWGICKNAQKQDKKYFLFC